MICSFILKGGITLNLYFISRILSQLNFITELVKQEVISDLPDGSDGDNDGGESDDTLHDEFCK